MTQLQREHPIHFKIYVYDDAPPPLGTPTTVSLCPWGRFNGADLTGDTELVTCGWCLDAIRELGLAEDDAEPELWPNEPDVETSGF